MGSTGEGEVLEKGIADKDRIDILLHEYDTLRDEIVSNVARQQTFLSIGIAGIRQCCQVGARSGRVEFDP